MHNESYRYVLPVLEELGGGNLATVLLPPKEIASNVKVGHIFAIDPITHPLWANYITTALEHGLLKCLPEPLIVGKGLENIQEGLYVNKRGVSAQKVVIEL